MGRRTLLGGALLGLAGCASFSPEPVESADGWTHVRLPGKKPSRYRTTLKEGRAAIEARAEGSASLWRRPLDLAPEALGEVSFSWWVQSLLPSADVRDAGREDAVVRVLFAFDGDRSRLSGRNRALFELAELLTGEPPPFATLMYVWDRNAPLESVIHNPRTDRIRKIVVDSGPANLGRWREHRRRLDLDFQRAFGEAPGRLQSVALMSDADNTGGSARAWYGAVELAGQSLTGA